MLTLPTIVVGCVVPDTCNIHKASAPGSIHGFYTKGHCCSIHAPKFGRGEWL